MARRTKRTNKPAGSSQPRRQVVTGRMEVSVLRAPAQDTFVPLAIPLIPTFEVGSRLYLIATQYSQFSIESSSLQFVAAAPTNFSGRVMIAHTFDTADPIPSSSHQMWQLQGCRSTPPYRSLSVRLPSNSGEKRRFPVIDSQAWVDLSPPDRQIYTPATAVISIDNTAQNGNFLGSVVWNFRIAFYNANHLQGNENASTVLTLTPSTVGDEEDAQLQG